MTVFYLIARSLPWHLALHVSGDRGLGSRVPLVLILDGLHFLIQDLLPPASPGARRKCEEVKNSKLPPPATGRASTGFGWMFVITQNPGNPAR